MKQTLVCVSLTLFTAVMLAGHAALAQQCEPEAALEFDGVDDCVTVPFDPSFPVEVFTLTAWIRSQGPSDAFGAIIAYGEDLSTDNSPWEMMVDQSGALMIGIEDISDSGPLYLSDSVVTDGSWHHVAASRNLAGTLRLYVDGVNVTTFTSTTIPSPNSTRAISIGCEINRPQGPLWFFDGSIDEVSMWNVALSDEDIDQIYRQRISDPMQPALRGYWTLDEGSGQVTADISPPRNHGFLGETPDVDSADPSWVVSTAPVCAELPISIDIKPGNGHNPINPRSKGMITVAILTSADFDAWEVDPSTVALGPGGAQVVNGQSQDVDQDGDLDMVMEFRTEETGIACGDTEAGLTGETFDGQLFAGTDSITTVGCTCVLWE